MSFALATARKDLARRWQDRTAMLLWLGLPFLIGGLITAMASGGGGKPQGTLMIADLDGGLLSSVFAGAFSQGELGDLIVVETVSVEDGTQRIENGEASGFLIIPEGFTEAFVEDTPVRLVLKTNPSQTILPGIIEDVTEVLLDAGFYARQLLGDELDAITSADLDGAQADLFVAEMSVQIQDKMEAIGPKVFPPIIEIEVVPPPPSEPQPDIGLLFLPGIVLMAVLFSASGMSSDFWVERDQGTLRRLVSSPSRLISFVAGKSLAATVIVGGIALIALLIGFIWHGISWSKLLPSLLWVSLGGLGLFAWFAALNMLFPNQKAANIVLTILLFPLLMAGGSFFPLAALPDWIAQLGRLSPNGFVADRLTTEVTAESAWSIDLRSWLTALLIAVTGLVVCSWRLGAGFARR